jgi:hypothetical protein
MNVLLPSLEQIFDKPIKTLGSYSKKDDLTYFRPYLRKISQKNDLQMEKVLKCKYEIIYVIEENMVELFFNFAVWKGFL